MLLFNYNRLFAAQGCGDNGDRTALQKNVCKQFFSTDEPHYSVGYLLRWKVTNCSDSGKEEWAQMHVCGCICLYEIDCHLGTGFD